MSSNSVPTQFSFTQSQTQPNTGKTPMQSTDQVKNSRIIDGNNLGISLGPTIRAPNTSTFVNRGFDYQGHLDKFNAAQRNINNQLANKVDESFDEFDTRTAAQIARSKAAALDRLNNYKRGGIKRKRQTKRHEKRQTKRNKSKKSKTNKNKSKNVKILI
jgi:hypothetical protein